MHRSLLAVVLAAGCLLARSPGIAAAPAGARVVPNAPYADAFRARVRAEVVRRSGLLLEELRSRVAPGADPAQAWTPGETGLVLLALLKSGVSMEDPVVDAGFARLRATRPAKVLDTTLGLLAVAARYDGIGDPFAVEALDAKGNHVVPPPTSLDLEPSDRKWLEGGRDFLLANHHPCVPPGAHAEPAPAARESGKGKKPGGGHGKAVPAEPILAPPKGWTDLGPEGADVESTQFALLGLKAVARCGVAVPETAWASALSLLLDWQQSVGAETTLHANEVRGSERAEWTERAVARGFQNYGLADPEGGVTSGRTIAGLTAMIVCQSELWESSRFPAAARTRTRTAIRDGLAWMEHRFDVGQLRGNPSVIRPFELYALGRMGVLARLRFLGDRDLYAEGAEAVLARSAGTTQGMYMCFELLFLLRVGVRVTVPAITPGETEPAAGGDKTSGR